MKDNFINEKFCILKSHEKCNSLGISKDLVYSKKIIKDEELKRELNNNSELIIIATPFYE